MGDAVIKLKTNELLLRELRSGKKPTHEDVRKQRVSFVFGSLDSKSTMTREEVRKIVEKAD